MQSEKLQALTAKLADRYRIEAELGSGGMAVVFLAEDLKHGRKVAIKVLTQEVAAAVGQRRFLREIEIAARLTHPHILPLYDSAEVDGYLYYVMPYIEGESLRDRLNREKQLSIDEATRITVEVAGALSYAHRNQVVHRDIKPENILFQDGRAIVADFGIARAVDASAKEPLTSHGLVLGTAFYMSPEQGFGNREVDERSDVYSLGCVLYEMLAGEPPFTGPTPQAILARHASADVPSLRVIRPDIPERMEHVVRKALTKLPVDRFTTADAFAKATEAAVASKHRFKVRPALMVAVAVTVLSVGLIARELTRPALREQDWILVADFEGPSDDRQLAAGLRELVTTDFEQSERMRIVPRRQLNEVMRLAGVAETTYVGVELGRQLAQRSSVRAVMLGSIRPLGGSDYSITLHVVGTDKPDEIASVAGTATDQTLIGAVQDLSRELRQRLGERTSQIEMNRALRDVATPSFDAFRKYNESLDLALMRGDLASANRLLGEAIAVDPAFAEGWAALGRNYLAARQLDSARSAFSRALSLPERLSVAQRYRLQGDAAYALDHDLVAAIRWYDFYLAEVPHSRSGRSNRAVYLSALGRYEDALADLREAVAVNPFGPEVAQPTLLNLAAVLVVLGRVKEARDIAGELLYPFGAYANILLAAATSDWENTARLAAAVADSASAPSFLRIHAVTSLAAAKAASGAVQSADSILRAASTNSRGATARWYERARWLLAVAGKNSRARSSVPASDTTPGARLLSALWGASAEDTVRARAALLRFQASPRQELATIGSGPLLVEGWIAARNGRWRQVADLLSVPARQGEHDPTFLDRVDGFALRWLVATAYEQLGQLDSATIYLDLVLRPTNLPPGHYALRGILYGFAHHRLGVLHDRLGNRDAAVRHLDAFLASFLNADSMVQPLLSEARTLRDRLRSVETKHVQGLTYADSIHSP